MKNKLFEFAIEPFLPFVPALLIAMLVSILVGVIQKRKNEFYDNLAKKYNLVYSKNQQIDLMRSFRSRLFKYEKTVKTSGVFNGSHNDHDFVIFTKSFYARYSIRNFTVGSSEFGKTEFPHILLKSKKMFLYQKAEKNDRKISIEEGYLKDFDLYCPEDYEIEALQIFTEPLLASIQEISTNFSIEFGGNRFYVYVDKDIQSKRNEKDMVKIMNTVKEIIDKTDGLLFRLRDDFEVLDERFKNASHECA